MSLWKEKTLFFLSAIVIENKARFDRFGARSMTTAAYFRPGSAHGPDLLEKRPPNFSLSSGGR